MYLEAERVKINVRGLGKAIFLTQSFAAKVHRKPCEQSAYGERARTSHLEGKGGKTSGSTGIVRKEDSWEFSRPG